MFYNSIERVLDKWDALQFAVMNQTGGQDSKAIGQWLVGVTEQYFKENDNLESVEVADFLTTILDDELNTLVEDGSDLEISKLLCDLFRLHQQGNISSIEEILSKYNSSHNLVSIKEGPVQEDDYEMMENHSSIAVVDEISALSISERGPDDHGINVAQQGTSTSSFQPFSPFPNDVQESTAPNYVQESTVPNYVQESTFPIKVQESTAPNNVQESTVPNYVQEYTAPNVQESIVPVPNYVQEYTAPNVQESTAPNNEYGSTSSNNEYGYTVPIGAYESILRNCENESMILEEENDWTVIGKGKRKT